MLSGSSSIICHANQATNAGRAQPAGFIAFNIPMQEDAFMRDDPKCLTPIKDVQYISMP